MRRLPSKIKYRNQHYKLADFKERGALKCPGATLTTDGTGYWSEQAKPVKCRLLRVVNSQAVKGGFIAELRVFFDPKEWNTHKDGWIYTDKRWLKELRAYLQTKLQFSSKAARDVDYSEHGMQGDDYVSLDAGATFVKEWDAHQPKK